MVPFGSWYNTAPHLGGPKGDHNFDNHPYAWDLGEIRQKASAEEATALDGASRPQGAASPSAEPAWSPCQRA